MGLAFGVEVAQGQGLSVVESNLLNLVIAAWCLLLVALLAK
jgi:hypothetical protein